MSTDAGTPTPRTRYSEAEIEAIWLTPQVKLRDCEYRHVFEQAIVARQLEHDLSALRAAHEAAQAEIAALRENAERYRRVKRDHEIPWNIDVPDTIAGRFYVMYGGDPVGCLEGELDAAIDAARKAK